MLGELIKRNMVEFTTKMKFHCEDLPRNILPNDVGVHHSYAIWKQFPYTNNPKDKVEKKLHRGRVAEFIG